MKAQVSIFMIVVLGLIILVGVLVALTLPGFKKAPVHELGPKTKPVKGFVEQCFLGSTVAGLRLLGEQGGVIYRAQGGFVPDSFKNDNFTTEYHGKRVWYSIIPDSVSYGKSCAAKDLGGRYDYQSCPSITFPFYSENSDRIVFGTSSSKKAHDIDGKLVSNMRLLNTLNLPGLYERQGPQRQVAWIQPLLSPNMKIRSDLAEFIKNNVSRCLNFSELKKEGYIVVPTGEPVITPVFSEEFTRVDIVYPLKIIDNRTNQSTMLSRFSVETKIRFGKIYKYVNDILRKEAEDYSFNLSSAQPLDDISLESLEPKGSDKKRVYIVSFVDHKSLITNNTAGVVNYKFLGAIPDSPPAISYIHYRNLSAVPGLASFLRAHCGFQDAPHGVNMLAKGVFQQLNRKIIQCIFDAYRNVTKLQGNYRPAYDPDDDKLAWDFRTSDCGWNESCIYDNETEFDNGMESRIILRFYEVNNSKYEDFMVIPLKLYNYAPSHIIAECVGPYYGSYMYLVGAENPETGPNRDELSMLQPKVISGTTAVESYEPADITQGREWWHVLFKNKTGTHMVRFTVVDSFGATNTTVLPIKIPCP